MANEPDVAQNEPVSLDTQLVNWVAYLTFRGTHDVDVTNGRVTGLTRYVNHLESRERHTGQAITTRDAVATLQQTEQKQYRAAARELVEWYMKKHSTEYASDEIKLPEAVDKIVEKLTSGCLTIYENQTDAEEREELPTCRNHSVMRLAELMVHGHSLGDYFGNDKHTPLAWADSSLSYRKQA